MVADLLHYVRVEAASGDSGGPDANPRGIERRAGLAGDRVPVKNDVRGRERIRGVAAGQVRVRVPEVD